MPLECYPREARAKWLIVAALSVICYLLLWYWGYLGRSVGGVILIVAIPTAFRVFSSIFNSIETAVLGVMIIVPLVALTLPVIAHLKTRRAVIAELTDLKQAVIAARHYAEDHGGEFPQRLSDLVPKYADQQSAFFSVPAENRPSEPIVYFSGYRTMDPADSIIAASPHPWNISSKPQRCVARLDGSASLIPEQEFQALVQTQNSSHRVPTPTTSPSPRQRE